MTVVSSKARRSIKTVHERSIKALELRPAMGRMTATTVAKLRRGQVAADVTDGDHRLVVDLGTESGGDGLGPDPGVLIRGGLGACLAGGYALWAAKMDVDLEDVEVVIEADMDARGTYGVGTDAPPGYLRLRAKVHITSSSSEERVREMVEFADRHSPLLYDLTTALEVKRETKIVRPAEEER
jgi:uncharacterized OsmC-like protein